MTQQVINPTLQRQEKALEMYNAAQGRARELRSFLRDCPKGYDKPLRAVLALYQNWLRNDPTEHKFTPGQFLHWSQFWLEKARPAKVAEDERIAREELAAKARQQMENQARQRLEQLLESPKNIRNVTFQFCQAFRRYLQGKTPPEFPRSKADFVLDPEAFLIATENFIANKAAGQQATERPMAKTELAQAA